LCKRIAVGIEERAGAMMDEGRTSMGVDNSWFNGDGGYGYILPEEGGEAVFVHHTSIAPGAKVKSLEKGARVSYEVTRKKMAGLWAKDVCVTDR
jgi:CspA family cold shock protein